MIARPLAQLVGFSALAGAGSLRIGRELVTRDIDYTVPNRYLIIPRDYWSSREHKAITRD